MEINICKILKKHNLIWEIFLQNIIKNGQKLNNGRHLWIASKGFLKEEIQPSFQYFV